MGFDATGNSIMARSRVAASQTASDANQSAIIDSLGGIRVLLNNSIRQLYRSKMSDQKFMRDIVTRHTVTISSGVGACPDEIMRETLVAAQFQDDNSSLITYFNYNIDQDSGTTFDQLGYVCMNGDNFQYRAPAPDLDDYAGNLFVTASSFPEFPASMSDPITFPSSTVVDDLVAVLSAAIVGKVDFQVA